jgi:hypothetical protein
VQPLKEVLLFKAALGNIRKWIFSEKIISKGQLAESQLIINSVIKRKLKKLSIITQGLNKH